MTMPTAILLRLDKVRQPRKRRLDGDAGGAGEDFAIVREPASGREADFAALCPLLHLWRDYEEVAHGKLILDRRADLPFHHATGSGEPSSPAQNAPFGAMAR